MNIEERAALRWLNVEAHACYRDGLPVPHAPPSSQLDGALKRNAAMVNKLRAVAGLDNALRLCEELQRLRFDKFVAEFVGALTESALRVKGEGEVAGVVKIASLLHQRSSEFIVPFVGGLLRVLFTSAPKKGSAVTSVSAASASASSASASASSASASATGGDSKSEQSKLAQLKATLRILLELTLVGCVPPAVVLASNVFSLSAASSSAGKTGSDQQSSSKAAADVRTILEQPAGFLPYLLRLYLSADREHHVYAPLAVAFARPYCAAVVGTVDASLGTVFSAKAQQWLSGLLDDYYRTLTERLDREHKSVRKIRRYHEEHRITRGELSEAQKSHYDTALKSRELVLAHCHALAAAMGKPPPDISVIDDEVSAVSAVTTTLVAGGKTDGEKDWSAATFEDEDAEQFYTVLLKLDNFVPANYFSPAADKGKSRSGGSAAGVTSNKTPRRAAAYLDDDDDADGLGDTSWMDEVDDEVMRLIESDIMRAEEDENVGSSTAPATTTGIVGRKPTVITGNTAVDDVLSRMSDLITTSAIDEAVVQFCNAQFNCRSLARSYLIKTLVEVPRFRVDLLPYYARFIAILHPHLPEVGATVMVALHSQFRRLFRKPQRIHTEYRTKNVRYFGELAKFQVCPPHVIFYCFRRLVQPETSGSIFNAQHVEVACALLESCGRFMLKTPETSKKFGALVDMFVKKVNAIYLDAHIQVMVENALLIINPPATTNVVVAAKHRTPLHHFVRKLILVDLARNTVERTLDYLLSLPWGQVIDMPLFQSADALCGDERSTTAVNSPAIVKVDVDQMLRKLFVRIWKIRFGNIALMADLLAGISEEHEAFAVSVVDDVLELIRSGLEEQHQDHQRRILMVKYLGELYNYKLVSTKTLFDTLYSFIFLGHNGRPSLEEQPSSAIDSTSDFFRVRLICTLLDTFGHYLRRGPANVRLDHFLVHFQHYILTKRDDLMPMEVEYLIADTLQSIQPGFRRETDPAAALLAVENLEASLRANMGIAAVEEEIEADSKRAVREKEDFTESDHSDSCSSSDEDNDSQDSQESTSDDDSVDSESFQEVSPIYVPSPEEQSEFDKELQHVMAESLESRATEKRTMLDLAVPSLLTSTASATCTGDATSMSYQLLLKRRTTKQRTIDIPLTSNIVTSTLSYQQSKIAERQQLKRMVLQSVDDD